MVWYNCGVSDYSSSVLMRSRDEAMSAERKRLLRGGGTFAKHAGAAGGRKGR
jgi:hypothetical protein